MYGLSDETIERIRDVIARFDEVERVILYGSRAMGKERTGSDIDLAFVGETLALSRLNEIQNALEELDLPYTFDTALLRDIDNSKLREHIERVGKDFYKVRV